MTNALAQPADVATVPRFSNVAAFLRAPMQTGANGLDIAIFGVPFDLGSSFRSGSRHGPAQIREMSRLIREVSYATGVSPFRDHRIADIGDAPVDPLDAGASLDAIEAFADMILDAGARPLAVGGDHTISLPLLRAIGRKDAVALVQIDAHSDTQNAMLGKPVANGTIFRRAIEEGLVDPKMLFQIGIRGTLFKADDLEWAKSVGVSIFDMDDVEHSGPDAISQQIRQAIGNVPAYLTFDIDALDPSIAPGTGGLEPGGLSYREAQALLHGLRGINFTGADLVEVCPPLETGTLTAMTAANILFEQACLLTGATSHG